MVRAGSAIIVIDGKDDQPAAGAFKSFGHLRHSLSSEITAGLQERDEIHQCGDTLCLLPVSSANQQDSGALPLSCRITAGIFCSAGRGIICCAAVIFRLTVSDAAHGVSACCLAEGMNSSFLRPVQYKFHIDRSGHPEGVFCMGIDHGEHLPAVIILFGGQCCQTFCSFADGCPAKRKGV